MLEPHIFHVLTVYSVKLALDVINLSNSPHTKIAFNSLCAYASVNHLHWHLYYQHHQFPVQTLPLASVHNTPYHIFTGQAYPARGWVWLIREKDLDKIDKVAKEVVILTSWLAEKEVAHNVFMTRFVKETHIKNKKCTCVRGAGVEGGLGLEWVRIFVWARKKVVGTQGQEPGDFIMASFELSGQVSVFEQEKYDHIKEKEVVKMQEEATVNVFMELHSDVEKLFVDLL